MCRPVLSRTGRPATPDHNKTKRDEDGAISVARDASEDAFKKASRHLEMKLHPDRNQGDKEAEVKFKELNEADDVLKNQK